MRLLIVTQAVDREDPLFGFFHHWLEEFATHTERIEVICLYEGSHRLPSNVRVHSLGKENDVRSTAESSDFWGRIRYAYRFKKLIWKLRRDYDRAFVHMNPEYLILGGVFWRLFGKRPALWYNHPQNDARFKLAAFLAKRIFYTSPYAAPAKLSKAVRMPVGIDTELFAPRPVSKIRNAVYMQGRIMPSKRVEVLLEAIRLIRTSGTQVTATIVGPEDSAYGAKLRADFKDLIDARAATFLGPRRNEETPNLYSEHGVAVNLAASGHFDKSAFEPMACETPVVLSSEAFLGLVPDEWIIPENDPQALALTLKKVIGLTGEEYRALGALERAAVVREHSLIALTEEIVLQLR